MALIGYVCGFMLSGGVYLHVKKLRHGRQKMKYHDLMYEIGLDNFIYVSSDKAKDVRVLPKDLPKTGGT